MKHEELPAELLEIVTVGEAAYMWGMSTKSIIMQILRGKVTGRKSKGTWLVTISSMTNHYGKPKITYFEER
jgi:hypothetical protein